MTEEEWLASTDPFVLANSALAQWGDRKLRLFCCACCFRYTQAFDDLSTYAATELLERYADGLITESERLHPNTLSHNSLICDMWNGEPIRSSLRAVGRIVGDVGYQFNDQTLRERAIQTELGVQSDIFRCIFGNPFRPVTFSPSWLTETVTALAHGIYADRAFDRLPILADALQEAGCEDEQVLTHCRGDSTHARGCWVVDGVLGKG